MEKNERKLVRKILDAVGNALLASLLITLAIVVVIWLAGFIQSKWVGNWQPLLDVQLIVSIWVAELPLAYFVKYILGERVDRPVLRVLYQPPKELKLQPNYGASYYEITVHNEGAVTAEECDVLLSIPTQGDFEMCWLPERKQPVDVRPDRKQTTQILRVIPLDHLIELPTKEGWNGSHRQTLTLQEYRGTISIGAKNCRPAKQNLHIRYDAEADRVIVSLPS